MELQVGKWGNSLAVRLPAQAAKKMRLTEGAKVELMVDDAGRALLQTAPAPAPEFDKAAWIARARALVQSMPMTQEVVRYTRDTDRC